MLAFGIIGIDEGDHRLLPIGGGLVGSGVGPFTQGRLNEALSFTIGSWRVGACPDMAEACGAERIAESEAFIGRSIVCHDALCGDAVGPKEGQGAGEESDGRLLFFVRQHFGIGKPCGIVDGDMEGFPSRCWSAPVSLAFAASGDAVSNPNDAAQFFGIEVDELAWIFPLIANNRCFFFEAFQPSKTGAAEDGAHGGTGQAKARRNFGAREPLPA